jgi:antitoxin component of MazEF toxin-antitoxin module
MQKKLVTVGNSVAVVLDKSLRMALGIKPTTLVRVMTDGKRIIIEPSGERTPEAKHAQVLTDRKYAIKVANTLLRVYDMGNDLLARFTCGFAVRRPLIAAFRYIRWLEDVDWDRMSDAERRVIRRFEIACDILRSQGNWNEALEAALAEQPFDPSDPAEQAVGQSTYR